MSNLHKVCSEAEVVEGGRYPFYIEDTDVLIVKAEGNIYAIVDCCSHQDFPLAHGKVTGCRIKCKAHGAEFDLASGKALTAPAFAPIKTFPVTIKEGNVYIEID